jgi:hypothetical protein
MELHERLAAARRAAGFDNATDAAASLGVTYSSYAGHENGSSGFRRDTAALYARRFGVSLEWLLTGRGEMTGLAVSKGERELLALFRKVPDHAQKTVMDILRAAPKNEDNSEP